MSAPTTPEELYIALAELLRLSNHYAELLNMHDGGERRTFPTPEAWIARLDELDAQLAALQGRRRLRQRRLVLRSGE